MTEKKIDEEWKKKAAEEKENLASEETVESGGDHEFPQASLTTLLSGLASQALIGLGEVENPISGKREKNLGQAKYTIDLLELVREKTEGNLTDDEKAYIDAILYDVRMRYVNACG